MSIRTTGLILFFLIVRMETVTAQAFCALRDPVSSIQQFEPGSTGHRSITEMVRGSARKEIGKALPFSLHLNELGKHTLYVVMKDDVATGLVHARSEKGKWGLAEIVWYLDPDLRVKSFQFQRCRDRSRKRIESEAFLRQIRGKSFSELRAMLDESGTKMARDGIHVSAKEQPLAVTTLRSALKTIMVTKIVWKDHLVDLNNHRKVRRPKKAG